MTYPSLQEDVPDEFANVILNFVSRNHIGAHGVEVESQFACSKILSFLIAIYLWFQFWVEK
jgi:hypothetical protein